MKSKYNQILLLADTKSAYLQQFLRQHLFKASKPELS